MMGWLCGKTAKSHPDSQVAKLISQSRKVEDKYNQGTGEGVSIDSKTLRQAWVIAYAQSQQLWIDQLKKGMTNPTDWYFRALTAALSSPRSDILCMNKCICTEESQPADNKEDDEVSLECRRMDCWWEPISHTAEDRKRHLHRESLDGEAGELMVPSYKYRKQLIDYNESIYEAHKGECSRYSQVHEAMPCDRVHQEVKMAGKDERSSRDRMLIWDTGSTCNVHMDGMRNKESKIRSCDEVFTGFAEGIHTECKTKAAVEYNGMRIPTSYRVPGAKSNLGAGWTSRKKGISTYISGSGEQSFIQLKNKTRMRLFDKGSQPIVGQVIHDEFPIELGWMGIISKNGSVHTVQSPDGIQYDLTTRSHTSKGKGLSKLGGKKIGHKSRQVFTSWKYERDKGVPSLIEDDDDEVVGDIVMDLCGGMNCLALALKKRGQGKKISRYISVENNDRARMVAEVANPKTADFCGIDHDWCNDVWLIQEAHIAALGYNRIAMVGCGPNCQDFSRMRFLPDRQGNLPKKGKDPRPGLNGPKGKIFRKCIQIWRWIMKYNPNCKYLFENVVFDDMPDWHTVNRWLGEPLVIQARYYSFTSRMRAWWTNIPLPYGEFPKQKLKDPNKCMDSGRTLVMTWSEHSGYSSPGTIGAKWIGSPNHPKADTNRPVLVYDVKHKTKQHLLSHEIELLMGHEKDVTKHPSVSNTDRNQCLGNGWDMNVIDMILEPVVLGAAQKVRRTHKRPFRKAYMSRGMGRKRMQDFEFVHDALGHPSPTTMEIIQKMKVIDGMTKFAWGDMPRCIDCDKSRVTMTDKTKEKPEEFKPKFPMQHIYADAGTIADVDACGGMKTIIVFREKPGDLRGFYAVEKLSESPACLRSFLEEHLTEVIDRRAIEKGLLKIKPDGEKGAFGKEFAKVANEFGYKVDPSLPGCPDENQAEWSVNEVKRKTLTLLEAKCLPKKFFPLALKYVSQSSNMMPSRSHERNISPYTYVTGKVPHMKEMIPFCTLGWKPKLKEDRSALRWRGTPVVFLAWDSLYRRKGKIVLSLNSLRVQRAKMQQKHFVFGKSWLNFVEEEKIKRLHKEAILKSVTATELDTGMSFEKHLKHLDIPKDAEEAPMIPLTDVERSERERELTSTDLSKIKVDKEVQVYFHTKSVGDAAGWYNGIVTKIEGQMAKVFYKEDGTFSEHDVGLGEIKSMLHQNNWRKNDKVTFVVPKKGKLIGKISKVLPREVTIQFKGKASNAKVLHDDDNLKRVKSSNLSSQLGNGYGQHTRSERTVEIEGKKMLVECIQQQIEYVEPERKNETKALRRMFNAERVKPDSPYESEEESKEEIFNKGIQSIVDCSQNKDEIECSVAFREDTGQAVLTVDNGTEEPVVPKGYHDIQYINDKGVREKWYEAVRAEHQKSEDNCTFEWMSDKKLEELRKAKIPILRHVWVFKLKRDDDGKYTVYKARGCVDGSMQQKGIDYNETFAPTCREDTLKILLSLSVKCKWQLKQMDVGSAFTNATLDEEVYMWCPRGIQGKTKCARLLRALYGLKQSPRAWYLNLLKNLVTDGWIRCELDACLFKKWVEDPEDNDESKWQVNSEGKKARRGTWTYMLVYVDDILIASAETYATDATGKFLESVYQMTDFGWPKDFLGFELDFGTDAEDNPYCIMHQTRYIKEMLNRYPVEGRPALSPWESGTDLTAADQAEEGWKSDFPYREFCGSAIYLRTRPDCNFTVSKLCKWMQNPGPKMVAAAKRLLRYLKEYPDGGISFGVNHFNSDTETTQDTMNELFETGGLYANTDSSYADEKDHGWSTMGQILMMNGGPVHQKSYEYKAQMKELGKTLGESSVMTSTVQAEYVCLSNGAKECMAYSELVDFFRDAVKGKVSYGLEGASKFTIKETSDMANGNEFEKHPSPLMCFGDNEGSIRITKKREMTKLAKHITIKHHHIRCLYEQGCIEPAYVNTKDQIADVLTKGLLPVDHLRICRKFMVLPERISQKQATQVADLLDIQQLVKENNYGYSPWSSQAA